ncbi:MAG: surface antigen [Pedosphaera sp.]|nr:surface antigen [Pedosphaera sp.]
MEDLFQVNICREASARRRLFLKSWAWFLVLLLLAATSSGATNKEKKVKPAKIKISGYGILGNLNLKRSLVVVEPVAKKPQFEDANFVEDAALILLSQMKEDGFLNPTLTAELSLTNGQILVFKWMDGETPALPHPLTIRRVHFRVHKGVLFHYQTLKFEGLESIPEKQARSYFIETGFLIPLKSKRVYTPAKLKRGLSSLEEALERKGYESVKAVATSMQRDDKTGVVNATITVQQGLKSVVRAVHTELFKEKGTTPYETNMVFLQHAYSTFWLEDFKQELRTNGYHHGYPDTQVEVMPLRRETVGKLIEIDFLALVRNGPLVHLGKVEFKGEKKTKVSLMKRRTRLQEGALLDRIKVEEGRSRLAQLGTFESVRLKYDTVDEHTRDVTYDVKEGKTVDISLLFGYGSYDLLRGGVEIEQRNIWGRAHTARLKLVQSFKTTSGEYTYTMPELIGRDVDVFFNASALRRQEISFLREEYGGGFGVHKYFKTIATDISTRYNYLILNAADTSPFFFLQGVQNPNVGTIITDIKHDRRDDPLYPRRGYKIFSNFETASEYFGGNVTYQRVQISSSYHHPLGEGRWFSLGISHGVDLTGGSTQKNLPFNRRFFPGGENSIRGYQQDQASPRNALGQIVGAETFSLASLEIEQALTPKFSFVLFSDSLGFAEKVQNYPFDTGLFSVGAGLRLKTPIGPVRLEYGHNLNPRKNDPAGTIHFSLGFPF